MTDLLTTMRQLVADAESDLERLRAAIALLEEGEARPAGRRGRAPRRKAAETPAPSPRAKRRARSNESTPPSPGPAAATEATQEPAAAERTAPATRRSTPAAEPTAKRTARARTTRAKQAANVVVPLEKLLTLIGEQPGLTTTALAAQTGGKQSALLDLLKESEQRGEVRREGSRRATSWYRITDEDRIAARAAELAAQAARPPRASAAKATQS